MENVNWFKKESLRLVIISIPFVFLVIFWQDLPARIPMHWNLKGELDGYGSKLGLLGLAAINLAIFGVFALLPYLDPKRQNYALFGGNWRIMQIIIHLFFTYLFLIIGFIALGYQLQADLVIKYGVIGLFLILGNYLGTVRRNYFIGIRTPWTLSSDYVWQKTHRFAATVWVFSSLLMLIYNFWEQRYPWAFFVYIGVLALVPTLYSFIIYKTQPKAQSSEE